MIGAIIGFCLLVAAFHDGLQAHTCREMDEPSDATYYLLRCLIWVVVLTAQWGGE